MWKRILEFAQRGYHAVSAKPVFDVSRSPLRQLMDRSEFDRRIATLRESLRADQSPEVLRDLESPIAVESHKFAWYQRIKIPNTRAYTTSDRTWHGLDDPGWLNRAGNVLTPTEGSLLRPLPKWAYLQDILPDLAGKSVMEIGSNNGFFCFEFAERGARTVTGVDLLDQYVSPAQWMASVRGDKNVNFLRTNALLDLTLEPHQVVFMSETYTHFIDPLLGILRALNLAQETLIIDGPALTYGATQLNFNVFRHDDSGRPSYMTWTLSDGLMLGFLSICGVEPERVTRFVSPLRNHRVYMIDTTGVADWRRRNAYWGSDFLDFGFKTSPHVPQI
jgi:2-polyprenyl-3-methyl-5-hydroxy-6-metoxy-1,4-benzoquinol methylase